MKSYLKDNIQNIDDKYMSRLEKKISDYFIFCDSENAQNQTKITKCYTLSGLCFYLGITREDIDKLSENKNSSNMISNAKLKIENFIEENLLVGKISASSAILSLKYNFNWTTRIQKDNDRGDIYVDFGANPEYSE